MKKIHQYRNEIQIRMLSCLFSFLLIFLVLYSYTLEYTWILTQNVRSSEFCELRFQYTNVSEAFQTAVYVGLLGGWIFHFPLCIYHVFCFFCPGFYIYERNQWGTRVCIVNFLCGASLYIGFHFLLSICWSFFSHFEIESHIFHLEFQPRILNTLQFIFTLLYITLFCCQFPYILYILLQKKIINSKTIVQKRTYLYMSVALISSVFAPPEIYFQCSLMFVTILILEYLIFSSVLVDALNIKTTNNLSKNKKSI